MEITAQNMELWGGVVQFGILSLLLLCTNILRTKIKAVRSLLMPTAVLAGFILLALRSTDILNINVELLETLTYHGLGLGFIAMSLRVKNKNEMESSTGFLPVKNGAVIVSTYLVQALIGLLISIILSFTFMPNLFRASGILLPMAYGQGPGQANNIGASYEAQGFIGGQSFGLALAAAGFLCACIMGVIYLNIIKKKNKVSVEHFKHEETNLSTDVFQSKGEIPIAESVDKFSIQMGMVLALYGVTYFAMYAITTSIDTYAPSLSSLVNPLVMGFNFMFGAAFASITAAILAKLKKKNLVKHQYQNNYLLNRISGYAFDLMIIAGIGAIDIGELSGLWVPFILMSVAGGIGSLFYLHWVSKTLYKEYVEQGFIAMFGMMTGTISSGILLLREIDPLYESPAANNLLTGTATAIVLALPILVLVGIAPQSPAMSLIILPIIIAYLIVMLFIIFKVGKKKG